MQDCALLPENSAIVVVELSVDDVLSMQCKCALDIIVAYDVSNASDTKQEHQFSVPSITIDTDVLHDKRFAVQFDANESELDAKLYIRGDWSGAFRVRLWLIQQVHFA